MYRILLMLALSSAACTTTFTQSKVMTQLSYNEPPQWAREAIWYQIFVERFRNGNPDNNPTLETCKGALQDPMPDSWTVTPWSHNWYAQEDWAKETGQDFTRTIQMRRYGGDLAGVEEKIDYLVDLGITAVYFNPLNDAPSLHKYDARSYHHIDVTFGDAAQKDIEMIQGEKPFDPKTWVWTTADKKFISIIRQLHERGIKVVLDFSWNHTGSTFWAFEDIKNNGEDSKYKNWYNGVKFKNDKGESEFSYDGWYGIKTLPELRKESTTGKKQGQPYEGTIDAEVKAHIFAVCKRWMDPHGDGSCKDGIDGMRLDVAEHVPMGFWREFRQYVRSINPEFYLVGENWWDQWPDKLMDPAPWVKGDVFDAVMHYQWYREARAFFGESVDQVDISTFQKRTDSVFQKYPLYTQQAMMNLASSHDSPRLLTSFLNVNKYKVNSKPNEDPNYRTNQPKGETYIDVKLFLLHQFTFVGAPHIWNGDEMGMTGADDPDNRKPLVWPDIYFDEETQSPFSNYTYSERPEVNHEIFDTYKSLINLRKSNPTLAKGSYSFLSTSEKQPALLAYLRQDNNDKYVVIFNTSTDGIRAKIQDVDIYEENRIFSVGNRFSVNEEGVFIPAKSGHVIKLQL